jgi:hypothetical protein
MPGVCRIASLTHSSREFPAVPAGAGGADAGVAGLDCRDCGGLRGCASLAASSRCRQLRRVVAGANSQSMVLVDRRLVG